MAGLFNFRHDVLGELGRIRTVDTAAGLGQLSCEVVGDPDDSMTAKRAAIFEPLGRAITDRMAEATGTEGAASPTPTTEPVGVLENKLLQCRRCGAGVARLVFAPDATDPGRFDDHARMLFPTFADWPVPTWIIGPDRGHGDPTQRPSDIMQVLPVRGPVRRLSPAQFNPQLDELQERHCPAMVEGPRSRKR